MSLMLDREHESEAGYAEKEGFGRIAARVLLLSLVVTALVAGLYMAFGGNDKADPLAAGTTTTQQPAAGGAKKPVAVKPQPLTYQQKVDKAIASLPKGTLSTGTKRTALINYLNKIGIKVTADSSPATAASQACQLLGDGYSTSKMVNGVASGGGYTKEQSKAFLRGATSLYCPTYAKNFS
jgi:hypothetical protein